MSSEEHTHPVLALGQFAAQNRIARRWLAFERYDQELPFETLLEIAEREGLSNPDFACAATKGELEHILKSGATPQAISEYVDQFYTQVLDPQDIRGSLLRLLHRKEIIVAAYVQAFREQLYSDKPVAG